MKEAGHETFDIEVQVANNPVQTQVMQVVQAMVAEAGFNVKLTSMAFAALLAAQSAGTYQSSQVGWSGRIDPDDHLHQLVTRQVGTTHPKYCNPARQPVVSDKSESVRVNLGGRRNLKKHI